MTPTNNHPLPAMQQLLGIMAKLRDPDSGCPWDRRQTWGSLFPHTLEEVHEVGAAIDANNPAELCDELGDLLFQIVFYAQIAKEQGQFEFNTVAEAISHKMIRRHPHVFTDKKYEDEAAQKADWEVIKQQERQQKHSGSHSGFFDDISQNQPALMRSVKLKKRASSFGFDWRAWQPVADKVREELDEVIESVSLNECQERIEEEVGDLLLSVANLAHQLKVEPENALRKANNKFEKRTNRLLQLLTAKGELRDYTDEELDQVWQQVKAEEQS
ncbi:MAG: nucleoside triphosphate pyrophosphohydrolase [Proteobacteria bacterium]|nr:MAG: nucleoside triphosphate pyrophosphohydrolase [Pseudomonadota bacterium]